MNEELKQQIQAFLAEKRVSEGGWASVEDTDTEQLFKIIDTLINLKWGPDPDGDRPMSFWLIDRTRFKIPAFLLVPHAFKDLARHEQMTFHNLDVALAETVMYRRLFGKPS